MNRIRIDASMSILCISIVNYIDVVSRHFSGSTVQKVHCVRMILGSKQPLSHLLDPEDSSSTSPLPLSPPPLFLVKEEHPLPPTACPSSACGSDSSPCTKCVCVVQSALNVCVNIITILKILLHGVFYYKDKKAILKKKPLH